MMSSIRNPTPTRVRTPVRSSSAGPRASSVGPRTSSAAPVRASPVPPLRTAAAINATSARLASPTLGRSSTAASPYVGRSSTASPLARANSSGRLPPTVPSASVRTASPGSRAVTPLKTTTSSGAYGNSSITSRDGPMSNSRLGIVHSPRAGSVIGSGSVRTQSPMRGRLATTPTGRRTSGFNTPTSSALLVPTGAHARETSAVQKAQLKKENDAMTQRVNQLMAAKKPQHLDNYFRMDLSKEEDMRLAHMERVMVDPERTGNRRICVTGHCAALTNNMRGIIGSSPIGTPRARAETGDVVYKGKAQHTALATRSSTLICGSKKEADDEKARAELKRQDSARRIRTSSASDSAPWTKGPESTSVAPQRFASSQRSVRNPSPISFDPKAPVDKVRSRTSSAHKHHDVFGDVSGADARAIKVTTPRAARTKSADLIKKQMAAEPPLELPPRKRPSLKRGAMKPDSDIFGAPYGDEKACSVSQSVGRRFLDTVGSAGPAKMASGSDPNSIDDWGSRGMSPKGKRVNVEGFEMNLEGAAGSPTRAADRLASAEVVKRKVNPARGLSSITSGGEGLQPTVHSSPLSPERRHRPASASSSYNAPFGTDSNLETDIPSSRTIGSVPGRYLTPADKARGSRSPGFYGRPSSAMRNVFNWD